MKKRSSEINGLGEFYLKHDADGAFWFATVPNIAKDNEMELTIEVEGDEEPTQQQIELLNEFIRTIDLVEETVFQYLENSFRGSRWEKTKNELTAMYYLTAITLKRNQDWWVVLEPNFDVETIFNFFPRFTLKDYEIVWSNI